MNSNSKRTGTSIKRNQNQNAIEIENQFKTVLQNFGYMDPRVFESYKRFRSALERDIISQNFNDSASNSSSNLESKLWKICHYKLIEEYRKAFKLAALAKGKSMEDKNHYFMLISKFREFLIESQGFYLNFISKIYFLFGSTYVPQTILSSLGIVLVDHSDVLSRGSALKLQSRPSKKGITATLHRCLVALGDIARYKDSTVDKGSLYAGQYMLAKKYYWHALCLLPDHGNTYNQLAVLEAYSDRFTFALDLYFKSLSVPNPFGVSMSNLSPLFQKAKLKNNSIESHFALLISNLFPPQKDLQLFEMDQKSFLDQLSSKFDTDNSTICIDTLESMVSSCLGLLYLLLNSLLADSPAPLNTQDQSSFFSKEASALEEKESDGRVLLSRFIICLCNLVLARFITILSADFEALEGAYEPYLPLILLILRGVSHSWLFSCNQELENSQRDELWKNVGRLGTLIARVVNERFPHGIKEFRPALGSDEQKMYGCTFVKDVKFNDENQQEPSCLEEEEAIRIRCNQILYGVQSLCLREPFILYQHTHKGTLSFSMNPPVESVTSTPVPFDGGLQWRSAVGITSSISAQSPLSHNDQSLSLKNAPAALSKASGKMNEQPQINLTLSYLGLEGSPVVAPAAKFILPESAVKRNSLRKASFPSPIGSIIDHKETNGLKHGMGSISPLQGQSSGMHGHMQALFQNPFMPGIEFSATLGKGGTNVSGNSLYNRGGEGKTSGFDALFARLTPYQQSMVSPIVWDPNNSGSLINYDGSRDENVPP